LPFILITSKACEKLPELSETLIRGVSTYISGSAKRCAILGEFQDFFQYGKKQDFKVIANTRWLILHKCVERLLKNWEILQNYFLLAVVEDKRKPAEMILKLLNDKSVKAYLLFLKYYIKLF